MKFIRSAAASVWGWCVEHPADSLSTISFVSLVAGAGLLAGSFWGPLAGIGMSLFLAGFVTFSLLTAAHLAGWRVPETDDADHPAR